MMYLRQKAEKIAAKLVSMQPYYARNITAESILERTGYNEDEINFYYQKICVREWDK